MNADARRAGPSDAPSAAPHCPAAVTVLAVLTVAAGALALGLAVLAFASQTWHWSSRGAALRGQWLLFAPYEAVRAPALVILGTVQIGAGLGLFRVRAWARRTVLGTSVAVLLLVPLALLLQVAWIAPGLEGNRWEYRNPNEVPVLDPASGMVVVALMAGGLALACHALIALAVLFSPPVREALGCPPATTRAA